MVRKIGLCRFHFFAPIEVEKVVFDVDWNELFSSVPSHEMRLHFMTTFAVQLNQEATVGSLIEILTSCTPGFSRTAQNFVYTRESSVQRSAQVVFFHRSLE